MFFFHNLFRISEAGNVFPNRFGIDTILNIAKVETYGRSFVPIFSLIEKKIITALFPSFVVEPITMHNYKQRSIYLLTSEDTRLS